jgi:hypothetical protein
MFDFHIKIVFILILLKILSIIIVYYNSNKNTENKKEKEICMTEDARNFMICWVKFILDIINFSKAIIKNLPNFNQYKTNLDKTKSELYILFSKIYKNINDDKEFTKIIEEQIIIKTNLCYAIKNNDTQKTKLYSSDLLINTNKLSALFNKIKNNNNNKNELNNSLTSHTNLYIKSVSTMKKITDAELTRELVIGSFSTLKLLF